MNRYNTGETQFVNGSYVGTLTYDGVFIQKVRRKHIYRRLLAKGIDIQLHRALRGKCREWRLEFVDTGRVLTIPFHLIAARGIELYVNNAGYQIMVKLEDFREEQTIQQGSLL